MVSDQNLIHQAKSLISSERYDAATDLCIQGLTESPGDPNLLMLLAFCKEAGGDTDGACEHLRRAIGAHEEHFESRFQLGRLLAAGGHTVEARAQLAECVALNPNHAPSRTLMARLDFADGRIDAAISQLKAALRADQDDVPALTSLATLLLEKGELEAANEYASHAVQTSPQAVAAQMTMAQVFQARGYLDFAEHCLSNARRSDPQNPRVHMAMGALLQKMGRDQEAIDALAQAASLGDRSPASVLARARSLRQLGQLDEARQAYETLLVQGARPELMLEAADFFLESGAPAAVRQLLETADDDNQALSELLRARLAETEGQAATALERARGLFDAEDSAIAIQARLVAARLEILAGNHEAVGQVLAPVLQLEPARHPVLWEVARLCRRAGAYELAATFLEQSLARADLGEDDRARTYAMLVDVLDRAGRYRDAAGHFKAAAWQAPFVGEVSGLSEPAESEAPDWSPISAWPWPRSAPADGRRQPLLLTGWPCSGRELVLTALASAAGAQVLPLADWALRRGHLGLPMKPAQVAELDQTRAHLIRRRYLRGETRPGTTLLIEPAAIQADDLPLLARILPGSVVIRPVADERYLELHWRLAGYRQVTTMRKLWRRDQSAIEALRDFLPLKFVEVDLQALLDAPAATLERLCDQLELDFDPAMAALMSEVRAERGYRAPDHWRHYFPDR